MSDTVTTEAERFLTFTMAGEMFAIAISMVREILDVAEITHIPQMPAYMRGVVNVRGTAVPVLDLKQRFALGITERTIYTRIIILEIPFNAEVLSIGALTDSVKEVLELEPSQIDGAPRMGTNVRTEFIQGIAKHEEKFIILLDAAKVFTTEELVEVEELFESVPESSADESTSTPA